MDLMIFRHGIAHPAEPGQTDAERELTPDGRARTLAAAVGLARITDPPAALLTSPKLRALQTAEIVGEVWDLDPQTVDWLAEDPAPRVIRQLAKRSEDTVMIVGHEPTLSEVASCLLTGEDEVSFVELKKAGCTLIAGIGGAFGAELIGHYLPRVLRALAEGV